ncbi:conserved hypothetical protein [Candida tropicalis MYA-3404]|uniref:Uncharacterized protein n=1 Tax=Candida tropicalis (strain ATCC MYA-3404 / T1) TaxID=294747 RepID=C5MIQ4_CANTT|nr:conserved hypothetical protein [Candida tropicalis MYA-3404]EER30548.1 conserved hypothetical protein [Candida tropicalis MYA-3404]KAG4406412.1 hypothetical protein JTP64_003796 [Candida tropicalis]
MLRIFHFNESEKLKTHNNRYKYIRISDNSQIEKSLKKSNYSTIGCTDCPKYLKNYAILRNGIIELRSIIEPNVYVFVSEQELEKAVFQYYQIEIKDFLVFYCSDHDLDFIQGKFHCTTSRPVFRKIKFNKDPYFLMDDMNSRVREEKKYSDVFYYINAKEKKIELSATILSVVNKFITVDRISSVPLSYLDIYKMFSLNVYISGEGSFFNELFDSNDVLLPKYQQQW